MVNDAEERKKSVSFRGVATFLRPGSGHFKHVADSAAGSTLDPH